MFGFRTTLAALAAAALAFVADADSLPFTLGTPTFFGSGCPKDSVAIVPSTDGKTFSVLFSQFAAATANDKLRERKSCNLAVNLDVKPGFSVAVVKVDYRGNVYVPSDAAGSYADFSAEYFFAGQQGPKATYHYLPGSNRDLFLQNDVASVQWSRCGESTNFRINADVTAFKANANQKDVQIAVDSTDAQVGGFRYYYLFRRC